MVAADEDALICDFAETYHVFDYRALPLRTAATLAGGLGSNSRIHAKLAGVTAGMDTLMLTQIRDTLENIRWMLSKDGREGKNAPALIAPQLLVKTERKAAKKQARFRSAAEFERWRERAMKPVKE